MWRSYRCVTELSMKKTRICYSVCWTRRPGTWSLCFICCYKLFSLVFHTNYPPKRPRKSQKIEFQGQIPTKLPKVWYHYKCFWKLSNLRYFDSSFIHWDRKILEFNLTTTCIVHSLGTVILEPHWKTSFEACFCVPKLIYAILLPMILSKEELGSLSKTDELYKAYL